MQLYTWFKATISQGPMDMAGYAIAIKPSNNERFSALTKYDGYMFGSDVPTIQEGRMTIAKATVLCRYNPNCQGFTLTGYGSNNAPGMWVHTLYSSLP
jgi:hypothetical protein